MLIHLKNGVHITRPDADTVAPPKAVDVTRLGIDGRDFPALRPVLAVAARDRVAPGQVLLHDKRYPEVLLRSPVAGQVIEVERRHPAAGAFRITIAVESIGEYAAPSIAGAQSRNQVRAMLLASGLWLNLRQRPFGIVADPNQTPDSILVCATPADVFAPDPFAVIAAAKDRFSDGVAALRHLTHGSVYVTQPSGPPVAEDAVVVDGPFPAGLAGSQIHALRLLQGRKTVWWLNYQDVIAIGRLAKEGVVDSYRTVAVGGPAAERLALFRVPAGAALEDFVYDDDMEIRSGPLVSGRLREFLGWNDLQVTLAPAQRPAPAWLRRFGGLFDDGSAPHSPIIPLAAHDKSFPFSIPVVPLLRALTIGDEVTAQRLGCLDLVEEDMAVLSRTCPSGADYGALLRRTLDAIRRGR